MIITFVNINVLWFLPSLVNFESFCKLLRCLLSNYVPEKTNKQTNKTTTTTTTTTTKTSQNL